MLGSLRGNTICIYLFARKSWVVSTRKNVGCSAIESLQLNHENQPNLASLSKMGPSEANMFTGL
jgi:hypothetical protein